MKRTLPSLLTLLLLLATVFSAGAAFAQTTPPTDEDASEIDDSAPVARVARLTFVEGDVSFLRAGVTEWAPAVENLPLLAGDQLYASRGARAEVQLGRGNYIRLSEGTELTITELSASGAQFEITEGTALLRIERLATAFPRFEIDTPNFAMIVKQDGFYRIDVRGENDSKLIVRTGEAEVSTDEASFKVRAGHALHVDTATSGRLELASDTTLDGWDQWSHDRDTTIARTTVDLAPDDVSSYETDNSDFYGASDLSSYGTWTNYSSYGQCWIPRVGSDWAPYRSGQWLWIPAVGWTWLSSEPWGWAPYHYGRWASLPGLGWAWIPGFGSPYRRYGYVDYHWRPALVSFFNSPTPRGNYVGWYPLAPGERWRRPDHRRNDDRAHLQYPSPRNGWQRPVDGRPGIGRPQPHNGMTILPADSFARGDRSVRPGAPGRDISDWINKGARAGLPVMNPTPIATAPKLGENDRRSSRRIAVPPNEVIGRPVVTRNPNADSRAQFGGARERRLISPRTPNVQGPALIERGSDRRSERRPRVAIPNQDPVSGTDSAERQQRKIRSPLPTPREKLDVDDTTNRNKRIREGETSGSNPATKPDGSDDARSERRRQRQESPVVAPPSDASPRNRQNDNNSGTAHERKHPTGDSRVNEEPRQKNRAEEPAKTRDDGGSSRRAEPRQEKPAVEKSEPSRQERHQEKAQERQQQPEQRKKP